MIRSIVEKAGRASRWQIVCAAVMGSEIITAATSTLIGLAWGRNISIEILAVGFIDALIAASIVAPLIIHFTKYTTDLVDQNEALEREIAAHTNAKQELVQLRKAVETSDEAIFLTDRNGLFTYINPAFTQLYGYTANEVIGRNTPRVLKSGTLSQEAYEHFWGAILAKQVYKGELVNKTKDGRLLSIEGSANPVLSEQGDVVAFLAIQRDITERKRAEEELRKSEEQYRFLFESNPHPMWVYDLETLQFLAVNDAAVRIYGYTREEFSAMTLKDIRPPEDIPALLDNVAQSQSIRGLDQAGIWRHRKKDGTEINVEITSHTLTFMDRSAKMVLANDITERKHAEEQVQRQLRRLAALREIDQAITASPELGLTLRVLLSKVTAQLEVDAADILLLNPAGQVLEPVAGHGFRNSAALQSRSFHREGIPFRATLDRGIVGAANLADASLQFEDARWAEREGFQAHFAIPLIAKDSIKGVLEIFHRAPLKPAPEWYEFLETLAGQAAIAIDSAELFKNLQRSNAELVLAYDSTLEGWTRALDLRDKETEGHTQRVAELTVQLARAFGMSNEDLRNIRRGALLHDIGKMGISDSILLKPGALTDAEWKIMRRHPTYAYEMLAPIPYLRPALDIPHYHHEKWDGTGYPDRLKGEQIPFVARIFAAVDVWDALRSNRPYREAWRTEQVREYIQEQAGKHFDPEVVDRFLKMDLSTQMYSYALSDQGAITASAASAFFKD